MASKSIVSRFIETRQRFLTICEPLEIEDYGLQAAEFASPPKWHLAHTSWFFETFLLKPFVRGYAPLEPLYEVLFNSYYNGIGDQHPRGQRGLLSRPSLADVLAYREHVDQAMLCLLDEVDQRGERETILFRSVLGIEHERQHQELFFTDLKYSLSVNPLYPGYVSAAAEEPQTLEPLLWTGFAGGLVEIGHGGGESGGESGGEAGGESGGESAGEFNGGFCFDNELPRHRVYLESFELANRLVSNGEYQAFLDDGAYERPELWLADGWAVVQEGGWSGPLHWVDRDGEMLEFTLMGLQPRRAATPVAHVSGYEADAYARWAGARLPREAEWELAATTQETQITESGVPSQDAHHPRAATGCDLQQLFGECWQWTQSAYSPYPGFAPSAGAIGEYNGKFMSNQWVLRGGSCVTPPSQARPTYRNFFYPRDRWQFSGIRLAR